MVVNCDETEVPIVPQSSYILEERGSVNVLGDAIDDKRSITALLSINMAGGGLAQQLIYKGTTKRCEPNKILTDADKTTYAHSKSHWSVQRTFVQYIDEILLPYFKQCREVWGLDGDAKGLLIWDLYKSHITDNVMNYLKENNVVVIMIPANYTGVLQPCDLTINKKYKQELRKKFVKWYAGEIQRELERTKNDFSKINIDLTLTRIKSIHLQWCIDT